MLKKKKKKLLIALGYLSFACFLASYQFFFLVTPSPVRLESIWKRLIMTTLRLELSVGIKVSNSNVQNNNGVVLIIQIYIILLLLNAVRCSLRRSRSELKSTAYTTKLQNFLNTSAKYSFYWGLQKKIYWGIKNTAYTTRLQVHVSALLHLFWYSTSKRC